MKQRCRFKISIFAVTAIILLAIDTPKLFLSVVISVIIHELGHILFSCICGIAMQEMKLGIFGAALLPRSSLFSYKKEIFICIGGPLMNFISVAPFFLFFNSPLSSSFVMTSIALATINLLPISGFDGGRIFSSALHYLLPHTFSDRVISVTSFIIIFFLWCFSIYVMIKTSASISLFVFSSSLFTKIFIPDIS